MKIKREPKTPKGRITWDEVGPIIAAASVLIQRVVKLVAPPVHPAEVLEVVDAAQRLVQTIEDALLD